MVIPFDFDYFIALSDICTSEGSEHLSDVTKRFCAVLIAMPHPDVQTTNQLAKRHSETEVEFAKRIGTYGKRERSKQYEGRYSPEHLLRNDNLIFQKVRESEDRRFWRALILVAASALLGRAPEIWKWISGFF